MKYVCELCGSIYHEEAGDPSHGVPAGTTYEQLPEYYECPGCGSGKEALNPYIPRTAAHTAREIPSFWQEVKYSADKTESDR